MAASAAALAEAGGLLMVEGRARDQEMWAKMSAGDDRREPHLDEGGAGQDKEAVLASGEALNESCDSCHRSVQRR